MSAALLAVSGLVKRFGGLTALNSLSLEVRTSETHALIGPNGAGKTTLIAQLQGELVPDDGRIVFAGRDVTRLAPHRRAQPRDSAFLPNHLDLSSVVCARQRRARRAGTVGPQLPLLAPDLVRP